MASRPMRPNCHWTGKLTLTAKKGPIALATFSKRQEEVTECRHGLVWPDNFPCWGKTRLSWPCPQHWNRGCLPEIQPFPIRSLSDCPLAALVKGLHGGRERRERAGWAPGASVLPHSSCVSRCLFILGCGGGPVSWSPGYLDSIPGVQAPLVMLTGHVWEPRG